MFSIRKSCFETNSSSTHSLCLFTEEEYIAFQHDECWFDVNTMKPVMKPERMKPNSTEVNNLAKDNYNRDKKSFWKNWDELGIADKNEFLSIAYAQKLAEIEAKYDSYKNASSLCSYFDYMDSDVEHFTTPSGDKMVALCYYGYDG